MSGNNRFLFVALLAMEATWWYTLIALAGTLVGVEGSPLSGIAVLLVFGAAAALSLALQAPHMDLLVAQGVSMVIALGTIYLAVALGGGLFGIATLNPLWLLDTLSGHSSPVELGQQVVGGLAGIALWWRGMEVGAAGEVDALLFRSFKIGLVVITVGAVIDVLAPTSLGMTWVAFAFFLAGLSALMLNQLQREAGAGMVERQWRQIALGVLGAVLLTGIVLSVMAGGDTANAAAWLFETVGEAVSRVLLLLALPLAYAMGSVVNGLQWLIAHLLGQAENRGDLMRGALGALQSLRDLAAGHHMPGWVALLVKLLEWGALAYIALVLLLLLYLAFVRRQPVQGGREARASSRGQTPLWADLASLLGKLFPQPRGQAAEASPPVPQGGDPRSVLLRLYYTTLRHFQQQGMGRRSFETPWEYERHTLARVWPGGVSRRLTDAFNGVRYGRQEPEEQEVREMEGEVQQAMGTVAGDAPRP